MVSSLRVIEWVCELLRWASRDPVNRWNVVVKELMKHRNEVSMAFEDAVRPELRDYIDKIRKIIMPGG